MNFRMRIILLGFLLATWHQALAGSQSDTLVFTSALIIKAPPGFPDDIAHKDPVEAAIVRGDWAAPHDGDIIIYNDTTRSTWERVSADSAGWYEHPSLGGGYVCATVHMESDSTMLLAGMGNSMVYVNGVPRSGNPYSYKDRYEPWEPRFDYSILPVRLKKGMNEFLFHCRGGRFKAKLIRPRGIILLNTNDCTVPDLVAGQYLDAAGAVVIINASPAPLKGHRLEVMIPGSSAASSAVPPIQPFSIRKIPFRIRHRAPTSPGGLVCTLVLRGPATARKRGQGAIIDTASIVLRVVSSSEPRKETFLSAIDGSVQYYAVRPASSAMRSPALFFSLHGAAVEAINQARAYAAKAWGVIVAPTNRRPYGFNWEDWGRWDALEVLALVKKKFSVDESRVYLTGHSMGGHGTYHVGTLFPDQFAALGPSAGWLSFWTYRTREKFDNPSPMRQMLMRATLASETLAMARNITRHGVYILHGSEDDNVPVDQSRMMVKHLSTFHKDFIYHEQQGGGHWWDNQDTPGADCVDWAPLFDFFARHARPTSERMRQVDFATPGPGISPSSDWVSIEAQTEQLRLSSVRLLFDPGIDRVSGTTVNVARMAIQTRPLRIQGPVTLVIDGQPIPGVRPSGDDGLVWLYQRDGAWNSGPPPPADLKGPLRSGTFKDLFRNQVMFVYGTAGTYEENAWAFEKARFDAERFWYQGNGSIDVLADSEFVAADQKDRNVVLYGNTETNRAWNPLLGRSPLFVTGRGITLGTHTFSGTDLACLVIRPRPGSATACVGAVTGTGILGMRFTDRMPYLMPGIAYPDIVIGRVSMLTEGEAGLEAAGFFGLDWSIDAGEFILK